MEQTWENPDILVIYSGGSRISRFEGEGATSDAVADPGFPVGGRGRRPPTRTLFGKKVCKNERNGS